MTVIERATRSNEGIGRKNEDHDRTSDAAERVKTVIERVTKSKERRGRKNEGLDRKQIHEFVQETIQTSGTYDGPQQLQRLTACLDALCALLAVCFEALRKDTTVSSALSSARSSHLLSEVLR